MRHQTLTHLESLVKKFMVTMTNQSYGMNVKHGFRLTWTKGTAKLRVDGRDYTNYYTMRFYMIDKTNSPIGKEIDLLTSHYPLEGLQTKEKLEEAAYEEFLLNGMRCLVNNTYASYIKRIEEPNEPTDSEIDDVVKQIRKTAETPKIII